VRLKLLTSLIAALALVPTLAGAARSDPAAAPPIVGEFAGAMAFSRTDGAFHGAQFARLTVKEVAPGATGSTVQWTFYVVPWSTPSPVCVHHLTATRTLRKNVEYGFRVASMTGSCIPKARSYRISSVDRRRVAVELFYGDGLEATGLLYRR
jgi:hypothetical protein